MCWGVLGLADGQVKYSTDHRRDFVSGSLGHATGRSWTKMINKLEGKYQG